MTARRKLHVWKQWKSTSIIKVYNIILTAKGKLYIWRQWKSTSIIKVYNIILTARGKLHFWRQWKSTSIIKVYSIILTAKEKLHVCIAFNLFVFLLHCVTKLILLVNPILKLPLNKEKTCPMNHLSVAVKVVTNPFLYPHESDM